MSKISEITIDAYNKGYRVDTEGNLIGLSGSFRVLGTDNNGYLSATIRTQEGKTTRLWVHKLQAFSKFGENAFGSEVVIRHKDGNPLNNKWDNILIGSQSDNMMDIPKERRILNASNPIHDHKSILEDRKSGMTYKELMIKYNISSKGTMSFIINKSLEIAG